MRKDCWVTKVEGFVSGWGPGAPDNALGIVWGWEDGVHQQHLDAQVVSPQAAVVLVHSGAVGL